MQHLQCTLWFANYFGAPRGFKKMCKLLKEEDGLIRMTCEHPRTKQHVDLYVIQLANSETCRHQLLTESCANITFDPHSKQYTILTHVKNLTV